jgi:hypothetical protein
MAKMTSQRTEPSGSVTTRRANACRLANHPIARGRTATYLPEASPPAPLDSAAETSNTNIEMAHGPTEMGNWPMLNRPPGPHNPGPVVEQRSKAFRLVGYPITQGCTAAYFPAGQPTGPAGSGRGDLEYADIETDRDATGKDDRLMGSVTARRPVRRLTPDGDIHFAHGFPLAPLDSVADTSKTPTPQSIAMRQERTTG